MKLIPPDVFIALQIMQNSPILLPGDSSWSNLQQYLTRAYARGGGVNPPPWAWYFTKTLLLTQRRL